MRFGIGGMMKPSSCSTLIMGTCCTYLISRWMNDCFALSLNIGILHIAVLLLGT
ncbi:hypothetical protein Gotur_029997 [Gossypium turneri]